MTILEIRVPPLGDFKDVPIIELLVESGMDVMQEQSLMVVESDKATMDIPSPATGKVVEVSVRLGDKISEGTLIAKMEVSSHVQQSAPKAVPTAISVSALEDGAFDVVVIGGGPGGYSAAFRAADLGLKTAIVERYDVLGGVCLNVGCIPSKALLHLAAVKEEAANLAAHGICFAEPTVDLEKIREFKTSTIKRLTDGLTQMAKARKVAMIKGTAVFSGTNALRVTGDDGALQSVAFDKCIIAAGSSAISLPFLPDDPRIVTSTGALRLSSLPKKMLVIGGGIIGLEMATVYSSLGTQVDVVERMDGLLSGVDRDLVSIWQNCNKRRLGKVMVATTILSAEAERDGIRVTFSGNGNEPCVYDLVLASAGRRPNGDTLDLATAGVKAENGFVIVDAQMRTNVSHIFAIGDIVGQPMLAHKAVHQGHVAAEVAAGHKAGFDTNLIPSVAYTSPEIAWVGVTQEQAEREGREIRIAYFPWAASGRAIANGADYGTTKLLFSKETGRLIGGAIIGPNAGDMIGEACLAIEMGADAVDIGRTIHPHPTLGETIGLAAEVMRGVCTDLPPRRR